MRPLKHYVEPGATHMQRDPKDLASTTLGKPLNSVLNPNLTVKGGGGGLINEQERRAKTLRPKGAWVSPFVHQKSCRENKKKNLVMNQCSNMERSVYVNWCLSLNSQIRPDKLFKDLKSAYANINMQPTAQERAEQYIDSGEQFFFGVAAPQQESQHQQSQQPSQ